VTLKRKDLDASSCSTPGCNHKAHDGGLLLGARCCQSSSLRVLYMADGVLEIRCAKCRKPVCAIEVAS
jgi:hypothetical protein